MLRVDGCYRTVVVLDHPLCDELISLLQEAIMIVMVVEKLRIHDALLGFPAPKDITSSHSTTVRELE